MQKQLSRYLEAGLIAIFQAENQIYEGLKTMAGESNTSKLQEAFSTHRKETQNQIDRLRKIAKMLEIDLEKSSVDEQEGLLEKGKEVVKNLLTPNSSTTNKAMEWLIKQSKHLIGNFGNSEETMDVALAAGAQMIEEFEVISYKALCALAKQSNNNEVLKLLEESLKEEERALETMRNQFTESLEKVHD